MDLMDCVPFWSQLSVFSRPDIQFPIRPLVPAQPHYARPAGPDSEILMPRRFGQLRDEGTLERLLGLRSVLRANLYSSSLLEKPRVNKAPCRYRQNKAQHPPISGSQGKLMERLCSPLGQPIIIDSILWKTQVENFFSPEVGWPSPSAHRFHRSLFRSF